LEGEEGAVDAERGKTTGRQREIGWLSVPLLRHYVELNGVDELVITKFDKIAKIGPVATKFCVVIAYQKEGDVIDKIPDALEDLKGYEPIMKQFDLWQEELSTVSSFEDLPERAKILLRFIEQNVGVPIGMIGTGARTDQIIVRKDLLEKLEQQKSLQPSPTIL
jgi:adenylosuccinate synthase